MLTVSELYKLIGTQAFLNDKGMKHSVTIKNVRTGYGRIDVLVEPVAGDGSKRWVASTRLSVPPVQEVQNA